MSKAEELFHDIAASIIDAKESKMFGALCLKTANGKAAVIFKDDYMVFKLTKEHEAEALKLKGSSTFKPMQDRPPMNGWTAIPYEHADKWQNLAQKAAEYVSKIEVKPKKSKR